MFAKLMWFKRNRIAFNMVSEMLFKSYISMMGTSVRNEQCNMLISDIALKILWSKAWLFWMRDDRIPGLLHSLHMRGGSS